MGKYFVTVNIPSDAIQKWMTEVDEATRKEQSDKVMAEWKVWMDENKASIINDGLPVGKTKRVTAGGIADAKNDINWFLVVEADSHDAAAQMFAKHPHLQIPSSYIDVSDSNRQAM